jgi:hypothetical protein
VGENPLNGNGVAAVLFRAWLKNSLFSYRNIRQYCLLFRRIKLKKFDKEYSTQYIPEVEYLKRHGIYYTFVKTINEVPTYKYTKTPKLFRLLEIFYT